MKRAMKGRLDIIPAAMALQKEMLKPQVSFDEDTNFLATETKFAANAKKIALMVLGTAAQKYSTALPDQQEILLNCADIIIYAYQMETAALRATKFADANGEKTALICIDIASVFCSDAMQRIDMKARNTIAALAEGDERRILLAALKRFTKNNLPVNTIAARQRVADVLIDGNTYAI
jgi:hypothetical protein